ncbi:hypothetical protein WM06_15815 [Burkholderia cepacia]|nr:hypothetical protein WM06_15815 [Burkholderia cepacia]
MRQTLDGRNNFKARYSLHELVCKKVDLIFKSVNVAIEFYFKNTTNKFVGCEAEIRGTYGVFRFHN